jgi:hypothetical protein
MNKQVRIKRAKTANARPAFRATKRNAKVTVDKGEDFVLSFIGRI